MSKAFKTSLYAVVFVFALTRCVSFDSPKSLSKDEKFALIKLGDEENKIKDFFGTGEYELENYPSIQYKIVNNTKPSGEPDIFFSLDLNTSKLVGKSKWIYQSDPDYNLDALLKTQFKDIKFTKYIPCQTRSDSDYIFINQDLGLYIAAEQNHIVLISYGTRKLIELRENLLKKKCPQLQR